MSPIASQLALNCFTAHFSSPEIPIAISRHENWPASNDFLSKSPALNIIARRPDNSNVIVFYEPTKSEIDNLEITEIDIGTEPYLGKAILKRALYNHLSARGFIVETTAFTLRVRESEPAISGHNLEARKGLIVSISRPFINYPHDFLIEAKWHIFTRFTCSLTDPLIQQIAVGKGVIHAPNFEGQSRPDGGLKKDKKFLGQLLAIHTDGNALVRFRDTSRKLIPLSELTLEAKPDTVLPYQKLISSDDPTLDYWLKIKQLEFVLDDRGRRNVKVLRHRLNAITSFLSINGSKQLRLPVSFKDDLTILLNLQPTTIQVQ